MRNRIFFAVVCCFVIFMVSSCATHTAPAGFLEKPSLLQAHAYGGWIQVRYVDESIPESAGELIAVGSDAIIVLSPSQVLQVPINRIASAKLTGYLATRELGAWTFFGSLSTLSHGGFLIISLPIWLLAGSTGAAGYSKMPVLTYPEDTFAELGVYARFPQGLPRNIDLGDLKPKPLR